MSFFSLSLSLSVVIALVLLSFSDGLCSEQPRSDVGYISELAGHKTRSCTCAKIEVSNVEQAAPPHISLTGSLALHGHHSPLLHRAGGGVVDREGLPLGLREGAATAALHAAELRRLHDLGGHHPLRLEGARPTRFLAIRLAAAHRGHHTAVTREGPGLKQLLLDGSCAVCRNSSLVVIVEICIQPLRNGLVFGLPHCAME